MTMSTLVRCKCVPLDFCCDDSYEVPDKFNDTVDGNGFIIMMRVRTSTDRYACENSNNHY